MGRGCLLPRFFSRSLTPLDPRFLTSHGSARFAPLNPFKILSIRLLLLLFIFLLLMVAATAADAVTVVVAAAAVVVAAVAVVNDDG